MRNSSPPQAILCEKFAHNRLFHYEKCDSSPFNTLTESLINVRKMLFADHGLKTIFSETK